jgi:hypothetical protein
LKLFIYIVRAEHFLLPDLGSEVIRGLLLWLILWLIGIPLPIILLIWLFGGLS